MTVAIVTVVRMLSGTRIQEICPRMVAPASTQGMTTIQRAGTWPRSEWGPE